MTILLHKFLLGRRTMYKKYCRLRDAAGLTDYEVSKRAGIYQSTFTDWKNGRSTPKLDKLLKIARVLNVDLNDLVSAEVNA